MTIERRFITEHHLRTVRKDGEPATLVGHAALFGVLSVDLGGFRERIQAGAFADAIERDDVRALWNHNDSIVLGRNRASTLALEEDKIGLLTVTTLPETQWGRDAAVSVERGDVSQMSFAFVIEDWANDQVWEHQDGELVRTILRVRLYDISPVTYPAYEETDVSVRAKTECRSTLERAIAAGLVPPAPIADPFDLDLRHRQEALGLGL